MDAVLHQPIVRAGWVWEHYNALQCITMPVCFIVGTQGRTPPADLIIGHVTIWSSQPLIEFGKPSSGTKTSTTITYYLPTIISWATARKPTVSQRAWHCCTIIWHNLWHSRSLVMVHLTLLASWYQDVPLWPRGDNCQAWISRNCKLSVPQIISCP